MKRLILVLISLFIANYAVAQVEYLVKIDPLSGTVAKISAIPDVNWVTVLPRNTTFDHLNGRYIFRGGDAAFTWRLISVDVATGAVVANPVFPQVADPSDNIAELQFDDVTGILYAVHWDNSAQTEYFVSIDVMTGVHTIISTIAGVAAIANSTYNHINGHYILDAVDATGNRRLYTIESLTGNVISSPIFPTVPNVNDNVSELQFDNTTGITYGLYYNNISGQFSFCTVDLVTGFHTILSALPIPNIIGLPSYVTYDHLTGRYFFRDGNGVFYTLNAADGTVISAVNLPTFCDPSDNIIETQYDNSGDGLYGLHWDNDTLSVTVTQSGTLSCGQLGTASVLVSSPGSYQYDWSTGATTSSISGLTPGTYTVSITSTAGCIDHFETIEVLGGSMAISTSQVVECSMFSGAVSVSTSGGNPPYMYQWSNGGTTPTITGLSTYYTTDYTVTVTDGSGCSITALQTLQTSEIVVFPPEDWADCTTGLGTLSVLPTTNFPPLTIIWSTGATTMTVTGLPSGVYGATLTNAVNCSFSFSGLVNASTNVVVVTSSQPATCGNNGGTATVSVTQGTGPYTYNWNTVPPQTTATASSLSPGSYNYSVTDATGCVATGSVLVAGSNSGPTVTITQSSVSCSTGQGGSATANPVGSGPFTFLWSNNQTTQTINNQPAGSYMVSVTDVAGCTTVSSVVIGQSGGLSVQTSTTTAACGSTNGTATATTTQGTGPYTYAWNTTPPQTTSTANGLPQGNYDYTVTDAIGCMATGTVTVQGSGMLSIAVNGTNGECSANDATASAITSNGTPPFTYLWSNNATMQTIGGLTTGTYTVTVTDGNGCSGVQSIAVVSNANGPFLSSSNIDISCPGANDGSIDLTVNSGTPPFQYNWGGGITSEDRQGLPPSAYTVLVTDVNGCLAATTIVISEPTPMQLTPYTTSSNGNDGTAAVNVNGGVPPFTYQWSDGQTSQVATGLSPGNYTVFVVDANGCTTQGGVTVNMNTSVETIEGLAAFSVYPVPCDGLFTVETAFEGDVRADLRVLDVLGRVVFAEAGAGRRVLMSIDLRGVSDGVYVVELSTENGRVVKEILIIE